MKEGTFEVDLSSGGTLVVRNNSWHIHYYFRGPDNRYNGISKDIYDYEIDKYIQAYIQNFNRFEELQKVIPKDGNYSTSGLNGIYIYVGGYRDGISLREKFYHLSGGVFPISTRYELNKIIEDYKKAQIIAPIIQKKLIQGYKEVESLLTNLNTTILEANADENQEVESILTNLNTTEPIQSTSTTEKKNLNIRNNSPHVEIAENIPTTNNKSFIQRILKCLTATKKVSGDRSVDPR